MSERKIFVALSPLELAFIGAALCDYLASPELSGQPYRAAIVRALERRLRLLDIDYHDSAKTVRDLVPVVVR